MVGRKIDLKNLGKRFVKSRKKDIADLEYMCYNTCLWYQTLKNGVNTLKMKAVAVDLQQFF